MKADSQQTTATTWYSTKTSKHASFFVLQRMDLHHRQVTDDRLLVRLVDIPVHDHFIENVMDLLQIEHDLHVKELLNEKGSDMSSSLYRSKKRINTHQLGEIQL